MAKLHPALLAFERLIDKSIPFLVVAIAVLVALEFTVDMDHYEPWPSIIDGLIVAIFIADLCFKYYRTRDIRKFVRNYWLDIIAVFPFYLAFRVYAEAAELIMIGERIGEAQKVTHEALLLKETKLLEEVKLSRQVEYASKEIRIIDRVVKTGQRVYRGIRIAHEQLMLTSAKHRARHRFISSR